MRSFPFKSWSTKLAERKQWHLWYAWRPVQAQIPNNDKYYRWVWGEEIERLYLGYGMWLYRTIDK